MRLLLSVPAGGGGAASSVACGEDPVLRHRVTGRLVSGYSLPLPPLQRVTGRECPLISCVMQPVLTAAESAVMHIRSADTIEADTILSIQYTQYGFRYDTDPIFVRSLI